ALISRRGAGVLALRRWVVGHRYAPVGGADTVIPGASQAHILDRHPLECCSQRCAIPCGGRAPGIAGLLVDHRSSGPVAGGLQIGALACGPAACVGKVALWHWLPMAGDGARAGLPGCFPASIDIGNEHQIISTVTGPWARGRKYRTATARAVPTGRDGLSPSIAHQSGSTAGSWPGSVTRYSHPANRVGRIRSPTATGAVGTNNVP